MNQHGLTGSWYEPATDGQGFEVEVYPDFVAAGTGSVFVSWFTYDTTAGGADRQPGQTARDRPHDPRSHVYERQKQVADAAGEKLRAAIELAQIEHRVLGPAPCPIAKLRGLFRYHVLVSSSHGEKLRAAVRGVIENLEPVEGVQWVVDVDPLDLL
jgi:hypothetical protein